ncbi:MAG: YihY/virulence factor BrkB family protein [Caldilineaceae bacterium]
MIDFRDEAGAAWEMLKATLAEWNKDNTTRLAAALAYYTIFAVAPLLIIGIAIAGQVLGREAVQGQIVNEIGAYMNDRATAEWVQTTIKNASAPKANLFATIVSVIVLLYGATGVFSELKSALNEIWDAPAKPVSGIRDLLIDRLFALLVVILSGLLLLASLIVNTFLNLATKWIDLYWPGFGIISQITNFSFFFAMTLIVFALIYKFLPDIRIAWRDVWIGATATALLFSLGRLLISLYLSYSAVESTYGVAGSLIVLLLWIYYSAQIFFLGAEFTQVYGRTKGSRLREHELLEGSETPVTDQVSESPSPPLNTPHPVTKRRRNFTQPIFDLATAVGVIGAISVLSLLRHPFRHLRK